MRVHSDATTAITSGTRACTDACGEGKVTRTSLATRRDVTYELVLTMSD